MFGEGVDAIIEGCSVVNSGTGYVFHENSNIHMSKSSSKGNNIGVDIIKNHNSPTINTRNYIPFKSNISYEISYAVAYLQQIRGYNPYN
ncbi:hypothetical protein EQ875_00052 [Photobacterium damselae subsp. damselae]|nr:hypothetical protein EQ875_00052 [Photobacterium damselae subsp. damselae]